MDDDPSSPSRSSEPGWFGRLRKQWCINQIQTCDDILTIVKYAAQKEIIPHSASGLIDSVLQFHDSRVRDIMIPSVHMDVIDATVSLSDILAKIAETGHSRYPVIREHRDEIAGILLVKELLHFYSEQPDKPEHADFDLSKHTRAAMFVPESKRLDALLAEFRLTRTHMAIVLDEFGGVAGLVTIEDVLEEIVGDIDDEYDTEERINIREQASHRFTVRALTTVDEFNERFFTTFSDDEYDTIGGLITHELGHLPRRGEVVRLGGFEFKILGADKRRLHLLLVTPMPQTPPENTDTQERAG
jgi:magnesium and cobalt transporter